VLAVTLVAWWHFGLSVTSGAIELATFVGAVIAWMTIGDRKGSDASDDKVVEDVITGGNARIAQKGDSLAARRIAARRDVEIRQENGPGAG
jgi:hypothetical protein